MDFFAGSGTTGRVRIEEGRNCIMIDNDPSSVTFFNKHIENMKKNNPTLNFLSVNDIDSFFEKISVKSE